MSTIFDTKAKKHSIDIIGASAGTGKTTRLTAEFVRAVEGGDGRKPIDPTRIIVCTFTNKAADELAARIRQKLLQKGNVDAAQLVLAGYVGTVNAICGRLLKDYALECGLSPQQTVIPDHMQQALFSIASASVLDAYAQQLEDIARRLSFDESARKTRFQKRTHWMDHVRIICDMARANRIDSAGLRASATRSWQGIQRHLGKLQEIDPEDLDKVLYGHLEEVLHEIDTSSDSTGTTEKAVQEIRECYARARDTDSGLTWRDWASLKKLKVGKDSREAIKHIVNITAIVPHHPRLHADVREYIELVFECAIDCLDAYQDYKVANGLVDFVDQEYLCLQLLDNPKVRESLRSRLDLVLIDEFQDTSPIQLALFLKLAELVEHSIWVGDIKQAIYGFRGTDPQLMQEAAKNFNRQLPLEESYRSRPELVSFSNELFKRVFPTYGIEEADVVIRASGKRKEAGRHTIEIWRCEGKELEACFAATARAVVSFLQDDTACVEDPHTGSVRRVRGSDVAILCRKNEHCSQLAKAIAEQGVKVAMTRDGLLDTPECLLTVATLRYLADENDKLALGQIVLLTHDYSQAAESADARATWLTTWLRNPKNAAATLLDQRHRDALERARGELARCSATEAVAVAINCGRVIEMIEGWGNVPQRLSNVDALRGLVTEYEDTCAMARIPASVNGFLAYLNQLEDDPQPASVDVNAVQILTYHGSKGLEWPIVILADLDAEAAPKVHRELCRPYVEAGDGAFDLANPLDGRWVRFWPWPFGSIEKDEFVDQNMANSPEFVAASRRLRAENTRLMYVGVTRARDLLVMAPFTGRTLNKEGTQWLDELCGCDGKQVLSLPKIDEVAESDTTVIRVGESEHVARVRGFGADESGGKTHSRETVYSPKKGAAKHAGPGTGERRNSYFIRPSALTAAQDGSELRTEVISIGERIKINGTVDMTALGDCVHGFLAVDRHCDSRETRVVVAKRIMRNWKIDHITEDDLIIMSDRLDKFLSERFSKHQRRTECGVRARIGTQRLRGSIDLLVEADDAFHIVDHKTFPGSFDHWEKKALSYAPQLVAYKTAVELVGRKKVGELLIHMPIVGKVIRVCAAENN